MTPATSTKLLSLQGSDDVSSFLVAIYIPRKGLGGAGVWGSKRTFSRAQYGYVAELLSILKPGDDTDAVLQDTESKTTKRMREIPLMI